LKKGSREKELRKERKKKRSNEGKYDGMQKPIQITRRRGVRDNKKNEQIEREEIEKRKNRNSWSGISEQIDRKIDMKYI